MMTDGQIDALVAVWFEEPAGKAPPASSDLHRRRMRAVLAANTPKPDAAPTKADRVRAIVDAGTCPGMSSAFNAYMGADVWTDPAYAPDASTWAAAWKASKQRPGDKRAGEMLIAQQARIKELEAQVAANAGQCNAPPPGWKCTRAKGHEGPCAAIECVNRLPQAEGADFFAVIDPKDGASHYAYSADLGRSFGHEHIKDAMEDPELAPKAKRWVVRGLVYAKGEKRP